MSRDLSVFSITHLRTGDAQEVPEISHAQSLTKSAPPDGILPRLFSRWDTSFAVEGRMLSIV